MHFKNKATKINLLDFKSPQMRAFHMSWFAFFLCFFAWFGIAPLMKVVRDELHLDKAQIGNLIIGSVAATIFFRLMIGYLCDKLGPRITYTWLLLLGSLPVMAISMSNSYESFLFFRVCIGAIGASFVITQYHTSIMFAPNVVGTANATSAGWGNLGGGVTQVAMPALFAGVMAMGFTSASSWRISMVIAGAVCFLTGIAYFFFTQDSPEGNFKDLRSANKMPSKKTVKGSFALAAKDYKVWVLFLVYAACFGIELTLNNVASLYYVDYFNLNLQTAGLIAMLFGLMNLFARTTGGYLGDRFARKGGLSGRVQWLFIILLLEGFSLVIFSQMTLLPLAITSMIIFSLCVQMAEGATFSVVPFVNKKALGSVSGIVGAGGNAGAVFAGFLFKGSMPWPVAFLILGCAVIAISFTILFIRFKPEAESAIEATPQMS